MKTDLRKLLAESQEREYAALYLLEEHLEPLERLMQAQAVLMQMLNEVVTFEKKNGVTEKSKASRVRVLKLMEIFECFSLMYDQLHACRRSIGYFMNRADAAETENEKLKALIEEWDRTN